MGLFFDRFAAPDGVTDPVGGMAGFDSFSDLGESSGAVPLVA
jgi:hypothetical protein